MPRPYGVHPCMETPGAGDHVLKSAFHTPPEGLCYLASRARAGRVSGAMNRAPTLCVSKRRPGGEKILYGAGFFS